MGLFELKNRLHQQAQRENALVKQLAARAKDRATSASERAIARKQLEAIEMANRQMSQKST